MLTLIALPEHVHRVEVFLRREDLPRPAPPDPRLPAAAVVRPPLSPFAWVRHLNRLATGATVVFAGAEPVLHPRFYHILAGLRRDLPVEIETRLGFDLEEWLGRVPPERFDPARVAPTLRVGFDPRQMDAETVIERALLLQGAGFQVGLRALLVPSHRAEALAAAEMGRRAGLDFTTEPFFGLVGRQLVGQFRDRAACRASEGRLAHPARVLCRSRRLLVSPGGHLFGCTRDLLAGECAMGRLSAERPRIAAGFHPCRAYGTCHPRDLALTLDETGRFAPPPVEIQPLELRRAAS